MVTSFPNSVGFTILPLRIASVCAAKHQPMAVERGRPQDDVGRSSGMRVVRSDNLMVRFLRLEHAEHRLRHIPTDHASPGLIQHALDNGPECLQALLDPAQPRRGRARCGTHALTHTGARAGDRRSGVQLDEQ
jgi:hypothetical protein